MMNISSLGSCSECKRWRNDEGVRNASFSGGGRSSDCSQQAHPDGTWKCAAEKSEAFKQLLETL